jgi:NTP pyrophosphatase (non-canonical NTP hydrolase)
MPHTLTDWQVEIMAWATRKGWEDNPCGVPESLMLMTTELAEAMEEHRKGLAVDAVYTTDGKPEGIPTELADTVIRILHFCERWGINLDAEVERKMAFNETRPYRHGYKVA